MFLHLLTFVWAMAAVGAYAAPTASELQPAAQRAPLRDVHRRALEIDGLLAQHWKSAGVAPNAPLGDEKFLRRVYLDLAGRIPTLDESRTFLKSTHPGKRAALSKDLRSRESYVSHFYNFWADILRFKSTFINTANVAPAAYGKWLKESLRSNKPYDQLVRELLSAKGYSWDQGAVGYYLRDPEMPLDNMALTTRIFLGTRIECAQCHDHPFDRWKQTEFYHLAAYTYGNKPSNEQLVTVRDAFRAREQEILDDFKREKNASTDNGKAAEERKNKRFEALEFRTALGIIRNGYGQLMSPVGLDRNPEAVLKLPFDFHQNDGKPGDAMVPKPIFGETHALQPQEDRAETFARWMTAPENPAFTRVIINRLWKKMFGVALVEPLDELSDTTASMVPELEAHLIRLMIELRYDMRAFLTILANTSAYQSEVPAEEFSRGGRWYFQGPALRRMTAEQAWDSMVVLASHEPDARDLARESREDRRIQVSHMVRDAYFHFDGNALVELAYKNLEKEKELRTKESAAREAEIAAKRAGDGARVTAALRELGGYRRERGEAYVQNFLMPLLENLALKTGGPGAKPVVDETYQMNSNPAVLGTETWRRMWVPGYGPAPKTRAQLEEEAEAENRRLAVLASRLGYLEQDSLEFVKHCQRTKAEWLRASELESPAPRGHFLRTMGQSDRDFVENANPNASIPQALALMNSELVGARGIFARFSPLMHALEQASDKVDTTFLALLSRHPTPAERAAVSASGSTPEALVYALINSKKFLFVD